MRPGIVAACALLLIWPTPALSEVVHLKNGGTIVCERIEERDGDLLLFQGKGTIRVPRGDVARIERAPTPPVAPGPATTGVPATGPKKDGAAPPTGVASGRFNRTEALQQLESLKARLAAHPVARAENSRQIRLLLCRLGEDDLRRQQWSEARRRFQEALGSDPHDLRARRGLAAVHMALGEDSYARSVLEQALLDAPGDFELNLMLGDVAERQDRPADALAAWQRAFAARADPQLQLRIEKARRQTAIEGSYRRKDAAHFTLRSDGALAGPDIEGAILGELESQFPVLVRLFDHDPATPIAVVVYPERDFYEATLADADVAGLYDGRIRLPAGGLARVDAEARALLAHELAHAFITDKSGGRAPRWLQEGLAQWVEGRRTSAATSAQLAREFERDRGPWPSTFTYPSALSFVEFLLEREGQHGVNRFLQELGRGLDADMAARAVTKFTLNDLQRQWGQELTRRNLQ